MPIPSEASNKDPETLAERLKMWVYHHAATLLLSLSLGLASIVWQGLNDTLKQMQKDVRKLTNRISRVVSNQSSQQEMIENNEEKIDNIENQIRRHQDNWEDQWQSVPAPQQDFPPEK